jgi:hypothetical protein
VSHGGIKPGNHHQGLTGGRFTGTFQVVARFLSAEKANSIRTGRPTRGDDHDSPIGQEPPEMTDDPYDVFICYRTNDDHQWAANFIAGELKWKFPGLRIFLSADVIKPGQNYTLELPKAAGSATILLALIGKNWFELDVDGEKRINKPDDILRQELISAFKNRVQVVPIMLDGADRLVRADLPAEISGLADQHAITMTARNQKDAVESIFQVVAEQPEIAAKLERLKKQQQAVVRRVVTAVLVVVTVAFFLFRQNEDAPDTIACGPGVVVADISLYGNLDTGALLRNLSGECAQSLSIQFAAAGDMAATLTKSPTVVAMITSDPAAVTNLFGPDADRQGDWKNIPAQALQWVTVGLDPATMYVSREQPTQHHNEILTVSLTSASTVAFRQDSPTEPVASAAAGVLRTVGAPVPIASTADFFSGTKACPLNVIIPGSLSPSCSSNNSRRATVVESSGTFVGSPIFGAILAHPNDPDLSPSPLVRAAAGRLLADLRSHCTTLGLINLPGTPGTYLPSVRNLEPLRFRQSVQTTTVIDSSVSMATTRDQNGHGTTTPIDAAKEGVEQFVEQSSLQSNDHLTVFATQTGRQSAGQSRVEVAATDETVRLPTLVARGGSRFPTALRRANRINAEKAHAEQKHKVLLLTDGVNVFTEASLKGAALNDLTVLVIGNTRGCVNVPRAVSSRCYTATASAADVSEQLAHISHGFSR